MSTHANRPNSVLLVIDMQNAALERAHERDAVVANVDGLVERATADSRDVVFGGPTP